MYTHVHQSTLRNGCREPAREGRLPPGEQIGHKKRSRSRARAESQKSGAESPDKIPEKVLEASVQRSEGHDRSFEFVRRVRKATSGPSIQPIKSHHRNRKKKKSAASEPNRPSTIQLQPAPKRTPNRAARQQHDPKSQESARAPRRQHSRAVARTAN
jgi:hypothetical protein